MVALFGSSVRRFWASQYLWISPPCGVRWIKSGQVETVSYFDTWSCSCNDGYPREKVTKRSKPLIYTHLHVDQFHRKITYKKKRDFRTRLVHTNSCQLWKQWRHSSLSCLYTGYWFQLINEFTEDVWEMVRGGIDIENSRINGYSQKMPE